MKPGLLNAVQQIDQVFLMIFGFSFGILVLITAVMIYFTIRYSRARHPEPVPCAGNWVLEAVWTVIPTLIVLVIFLYGWRSYLALRNGPADAMPVTVEARQFAWNFIYPNGRAQENLILPAGRPVRLTLKSLDVIHGIFIPAFRLKRDIVPGMQNQASLTPEAEGTFEIFCSMFCGVKHFAMRADLVVVSAARFDAWYAGTLDTQTLLAGVHNQEWAATPPGLRVLKKYGCVKCHSVDGGSDVGPTLKGLFGRERTVLRGGQRLKLTADTEYLKRAIMDPKQELVAGYDAMMAPYSLTPDEMDELLTYLKALGGP